MMESAAENSRLASGKSAHPSHACESSAGRFSMPRATWNGVVLAESDHCVVVEGNQYFPADSIHHQYFKKSSTTTVCPWKGTASYYTIAVDGRDNVDAAWYYPSPKDAAGEIKDHV